MFLRCKQVKKLQRSLQLEALRQSLCECRDAHELLHEMLRLPEDRKVLVVCLLWKWWNWRNKTNARENNVPVESLSAEITNWAIDSLALCKPSRTEAHTDAGQQAVQEWRKPEGDMLK